MDRPFSVSQDIVVLPSFLSEPVAGGIITNTFLLKSSEPLLVDCGLFVDRDEFRPVLVSQIDLADLRWLWLTHPDPDHIGSLKLILDEAPQVRVITNSTGFGILGLVEPVPLERACFLNPGERLEVRDRTLTAVKPPAFDNPATLGFFDGRTRTLFSSDCFGAVMSQPASDAHEIEGSVLREGQVAWAKSDFPGSTRWHQPASRAISGRYVKWTRNSFSVPTYRPRVA